jgi:hypothetical protein
MVRRRRFAPAEKKKAVGTHLLLGRADDGGEDGLGLIVAGDAGLAATGTIVDDDCGLVRHVGAVTATERGVRAQQQNNLGRR